LELAETKLVPHIILFQCPQEAIQVLGIFFSYNSDAANNLNFEEKIIKLKNTLIIRKEGSLPSTAESKY